MKRFISILFLLASPVTLAATGTRETFTSAREVDCSAVSYCTQVTTDGLFKLTFEATDSLSSASKQGFLVHAPSIEIANANGGLLDLNIMAASILTSDRIMDGIGIGAILLEVQDAQGQWTTVTQWSSSVGYGIYVLFNGINPWVQPLVHGVKAIRFHGVNGTNAFRLGMLHLTAY